MGKKKDPGEAASTPAAKPMKKVEAVRQTLAAGIKGPTEGVEHIKNTFGIEMTPQQFSTSKFQIANAKGGRKTKAKRTKAVATTGNERGNGRAAGSAADLARAVRSLVATHGVMAVSEMVQVFSE